MLPRRVGSGAGTAPAMVSASFLVGCHRFRLGCPGIETRRCAVGNQFVEGCGGYSTFDCKPFD
jgi:hypothetical protein